VIKMRQEKKDRLITLLIRYDKFNAFGSGLYCPLDCSVAVYPDINSLIHHWNSFHKPDYKMSLKQFLIQSMISQQVRLKMIHDFFNNPNNYERR
jgi:hypothetical protein